VFAYGSNPCSSLVGTKQGLFEATVCLDCLSPYCYIVSRLDPGEVAKSHLYNAGAVQSSFDAIGNP
jgi:hypothetical protein